MRPVLRSVGLLAVLLLGGHRGLGICGSTLGLTLLRLTLLRRRLLGVLGLLRLRIAVRRCLDGTGARRGHPGGLTRVLGGVLTEGG